MLKEDTQKVYNNDPENVNKIVGDSYYDYLFLRTNEPKTKVPYNPVTFHLDL